MDESAGYVEVRVWRTGTDLSRPSSVTVRSRKTDPPSADGERFPTAALWALQHLTHCDTKYLKLKYFIPIKAVWMNLTFSEIINI